MISCQMKFLKQQLPVQLKIINALLITLVQAVLDRHDSEEQTRLSKNEYIPVISEKWESTAKK